MHNYGETCHGGKAKWLSKSKTDNDYIGLFWIWMAKSETDYDYQNPDSDLDTINFFLNLDNFWFGM